MKKSIVTKAASIILASSLMLGMTACGDSSKSDDNGTASSAAASSKAEDKEITGKTETWGVFTVLVPDGWELKKGHTLDENDPNYCTVKKSSFTYFELKSEKDDVMKQQYDYNKKTYTNGQKDLAATKVGDIEWNGFEYDGAGTPCFELYSTVNGKNIRVSCCGFKFDSAEAKAVLTSIKLS